MIVNEGVTQKAEELDFVKYVRDNTDNFNGNF